jgi:hypothetical protein
MEIFMLAAKLFHRLKFSFPKGFDGVECLEGQMKGFQRHPKDYKLIVTSR